MNELELFIKQKEENIKNMSQDEKNLQMGMEFISRTAQYKYSYNFSWMGRPIIQFPQDMIAMQEIIWDVRPDLIIETGIAHGGSIIFYASLLELNGGEGSVLGIDIDIREHNRVEIEKHPMFKRIQMLQGSSIDSGLINQVKRIASDKKKVMVILDSNHTHDHVLAEINAYAPLVSPGSYCVIFDTVVEDMPEGSFPDRPWDKGNNPKTAVWEFMKQVKSGTAMDVHGKTMTFEIDEAIHNKLLITVAPDGYLKRVK